MLFDKITSNEKWSVGLKYFYFVFDVSTKPHYGRMMNFVMDPIKEQCIYGITVTNRLRNNKSNENNAGKKITTKHTLNFNVKRNSTIYSRHFAYIFFFITYVVKCSTTPKS